jgi:hypothetical protein
MAAVGLLEMQGAGGQGQGVISLAPGAIHGRV